MAHLSARGARKGLETELAKLFETTYRAWMIVCFQEMHRISKRFEADFDEVVDFWRIRLLIVNFAYVANNRYAYI